MDSGVWKVSGRRIVGPYWWVSGVFPVLPLLNSDSKIENSDFFLSNFRGKFGLFSDLLGQFLLKMQTLSLISKFHKALCHTKKNLAYTWLFFIRNDL